MKTYENMSSFLFVILCVWNWVYLTSFTQGPKGITITKVCVHCAHSFVWERQPRQEFQTFLSFSSFYPSRLFQTWGLHPPTTLLASTLQPTGGEPEKGSGAENRKPDCKQTWLLMLSAVTSQKVSVLLWRRFYELPLSRALNPSITHTCESMSQIGDESQVALTLIYQWHIWGSFLLETEEHQTYGCGDRTRQLHKKGKDVRGAHKQTNTCQANGWVVCEFNKMHNSIISSIQTLYWHVSKAISFLKCDVAGKPQQTQK